MLIWNGDLNSEVCGMTWTELNEVRNLNLEIINVQNALDNWRKAEALKIPVRDGLPKTPTADSRVERIAIKIADASRRVDELKEQRDEVIPLLEKKIYDEVGNGTLRRILYLRYIEDFRFCDIVTVTGYSEPHVYRLHNKALKILGI